ncbi:MAG TPA: tetrahydrodipicolinate N-succinyltransferase N-terminal domain-containing protein, partial [Motiliproteus sp.]
MSGNFFCLGLGIGTKSAHGDWLEVFYAKPIFEPCNTLIAALKNNLDYEGGNCAIELDSEGLQRVTAAFTQVNAADQISIANTLKGSQQPLVLCILQDDDQPASTPEVYLKLQMLSQRLVKPHGINLTGMFGLLPNVAWTNQGAVALEDLPQRQLEARARGELLDVQSVDKFPKMTNYVVPTG